jgi:UDPglucose--hexose-1-phosphate uridylyltransferase
MKKNEQSELRHDLLSGNWVVICPKRSGVSKLKLKECPFCNIEGQEKPTLIYSNGKEINNFDNWTTIVVPNKFPVFSLGKIKEEKKENDFYLKTKTAGFHELVITKDHEKTLAQLPLKKVKEVIDCYQKRLLEYKKHDFVKCSFIFHNNGPLSGASQAHPHSQIITMPFIDNEFRLILDNANEYYSRNKECLQCKVLELEKKNKKRIVFENDSFVAYIPFAPKFIFETVIVSKRHESYFENITEKEKEDLAEAIKTILSRMDKLLKKPSFNFHILNAPYGEDISSSFHYSMTIFPRLKTIAGFELSARMEIITMSPEDQASLLRKK